MNALARALHAETLKLRGTLALWMCVIAPATVALLLTLQFALMTLPRGGAPSPGEAWLGYANGAVQLWAFLMMPLFITLQSALLAGLEHGNQQWKHLLALPLPRGAHYLAKQAAMIAMLAIAMASLLVMIPVGGSVLAALRPDIGISGAPPWLHLARSLAASFAAGMLITALHTWIAIRWRSFTVAVAVGMTATVMGFLVMQSRRYGHYFPWSMPIHALAGNGEHLRFVLLAGLGGGALVSFAGLRDFLRRDDH